MNRNDLRRTQVDRATGWVTLLLGLIAVGILLAVLGREALHALRTLDTALTPVSQWLTRSLG